MNSPCRHGFRRRGVADGARAMMRLTLPHRRPRRRRGRPPQDSASSPSAHRCTRRTAQPRGQGPRGSPSIRSIGAATARVARRSRRLRTQGPGTITRLDAHRDVEVEMATSERASAQMSIRPSSCVRSRWPIPIAALGVVASSQRSASVRLRAKQKRCACVSRTSPPRACLRFVVSRSNPP